MESDRQARPYRGLFGRQTPSSDRYRFLDLTLDMEGGRDSNLRLGRGAPQDPRLRIGGTFGGGTAVLRYEQQARYLKFSTALFGRGRRYFATEPFTTSEYGGSVGIDWELGRSTQVSVSQGAGIFPHFQLNLLPGLFTPAIGELPPQNINLAVAPEKTFALFTRADVTQRLGQRSRLQLSGNRRQYTFLDRDDFRTELLQLNASFLRDLTRNLTLRLGYRRYRSDFAGTSSLNSRDDIDVGVDYRKNLSFSRRTSVGFETGSTMLRRSEGQSQYRFTGSARLDHQMGRTWTASALYSHNTGFVEGIADPVAYDAVVADIRGQVGRRGQLGFDAGVSRGSPAIVQKRRYSTAQGSVTYQFALARTAALQGEYYYFHYLFDPDFVQTIAFDRSLDRHGLRVGLSWWLPLIR